MNTKQVGGGSADHKQYELLKSTISTVESRLKHYNHLYQTDLNQPFAIQYSSLHKSTHDGNLSGVEHFILNQDSSTDKFDINGKAPIHISCEKGHAHILAYLLDHGSDINITTTIDESTPLMFACRENHIDCISMLLKRGAKVYLRNRSGLVASHFAAQGDNFEALYLLFTYDDALRRLRQAELEEKDNEMFQRAGMSTASKSKTQLATAHRASDRKLVSMSVSSSSGDNIQSNQLHSLASHDGQIAL